LCEGAEVAASVLQEHFAEAQPKRRSLSADAATFMARWRHLAGEDYSTDPRDVNRSHSLASLRDGTLFVPHISRPRSSAERLMRSLALQLGRVAPRQVARHLWRTFWQVRLALMKRRGATMAAWTPQEMYDYEINHLPQR